MIKINFRRFPLGTPDKAAKFKYLAAFLFAQRKASTARAPDSIIFLVCENRCTVFEGEISFGEQGLWFLSLK